VRVALDAQLAVGTATGIGEYVDGLASALSATSVEVERLSAPWLNPWRFDRRVLWDQVLLPRAASRSQAEVIHCTSGTMPVRSMPKPVVVTVHDVAWLQAQKHARLYARAYFGRLMAHAYKKAQAIVTVSAYTRTELLNEVALDPTRVFVAHNGVSPDFERIERRPDRERPLLLVVGTVEPRKALIDVLQVLPSIEDAILVSAGPPTPYLADCRAVVEALHLEDRVRFAGYVSRTELLGLYATATLALAPSHYEGFGYAVAQALCAGVPLIASDATSHPEIAGEDATLVPTGDAAAWREAIANALAGPVAAEARAAQARPRAIARFSWSTCAGETLKVYRSACS
jgi:glycosyltransferase involved in cell wall biosynthesis